MLYVDDRLPRHPKIFRAGALLGDPQGAALALALYMDGLSYAREHLTDGFLPHAFVKSCSLVSQPELVANVLASRGVRLWHRTKGGYLIHDYHHWNRKASVIKEKRAKERERKAHEREQKRHPDPKLSGDLSARTNRGPRALARPRTTYHVPLSTPAVGGVPVHPSTNLPALTRRPSLAVVEISDTRQRERRDATASNTTTDPVPSTVRTRQSHHRNRSDYRQRDVGGGDLPSPTAAGVYVSRIHDRDPSRDVASGTLPGEPWDAATAATVPPKSAATEATPTSPTDGGGGETHQPRPTGRDLLDATIQRLRRQLDAARRLELAGGSPGATSVAAATSITPNTDRPVACESGQAALPDDADGVDADRGDTRAAIGGRK